MSPLSSTNGTGESSPWSVPVDITEPAGHLQRITDVDEAVDAMTRSYQPGRLELADARRPLDMEMWTNALPGLHLNYLSYGTDVTITAPPMERYVLCIPIAGRLRIGSARTQIEASVHQLGAAISPGGPVFFEDWSEDCRVLTARFAPDLLEEQLSGMLDGPLTGPIQFALGMNLSEPSVRPVLRALTLVRNELNDPDGITADPTMGADLARLVMTGLLLAQPHNYSDQLSRPGRPPAPGRIREAIEFMESHPTQIAGVADLAQAAKLSVRALEAGFRKHVGTTPMAYLRRIRLAGVRSELQASDATVTTAAALARRWGFHHYGRFATAYRERYGEAPADTLRQGRRSTTG